MLTATWISVGVVVSATFMILGLPLGLAWPYLFQSILQLQLELSPTSLMFSSLGPDSPIHIYMDMYLWNLTNSAEFEKNKSVIPHFEEIGPFVYQLQSERVNVTWNGNSTVTFSPKTKYMFIPDESEDPKTPITNVHPVPAVVSYFARTWTSELFTTIINAELELRESFLKTDTAENWLFNGIDDTLIALMAPLSKVININIPGEKFAWFFGKNDSTADGALTMFTGADGLEKVGVLTHWKGMTESGAYNGACGAVGGSSGQAFPHMDSQPDFLPVFVPDACSQVKLEAAGETEVEDITGWKFVGGNKTFDNGTINIENECFCTGECTNTGLRNVSDCKSGAPAFVSFPHFYLADETYQSAVSGMNPNASLHESTVVLEPTLGIPLSVSIQIQVNLMLQKYNNELYKDMPRIYVPVIWFRERAALTPDLANLLKVILVLPTVGLVVFYLVGGIALIAFITFVYLAMKQKQPLLENYKTSATFPVYKMKSEKEIDEL